MAVVLVIIHMLMIKIIGVIFAGSSASFLLVGGPFGQHRRVNFVLYCSVLYKMTNCKDNKAKPYSFF